MDTLHRIFYGFVLGYLCIGHNLRSGSGGLKYCLLAVSIILPATFIFQLPIAWAGDESGLIVPLYSYPGKMWDKLIQEKNAYPDVPIIAIINPDNGPGIKDVNYVTGVQKLQMSGIVVLGYVYTQHVDVTAIRNDINEYKNWYGVNGIFFDAMSNTPGHEAFYKQLTNYTKSMGMNFTVGNPGSDTLPSYIGTVDNIVIHDNSGVLPISHLGGWHMNFTKSNFSTISYGVGSINQTYLRNATRNVQYLYLTDLSLPNPFEALPSYIDKLMNALNTQRSLASVTVDAYSDHHDPLDGFWTTVKSGSNTTSGFTPLTFEVIRGKQYEVTVSNYGNYTFDHWDNGISNKTRIIQTTQNMTLSAYYTTDLNQTQPAAQSIRYANDTTGDQLISTQPPNGTLQEPSTTTENLGVIETTIMYTGGDRADYSLLSFKVFLDSSQKPYREIKSVSSNPFYIDNLPIGHRYKVEVIANGMISDVEYVDLEKHTAQMNMYLPFPGGMRLHIFYDDGYTPISNAVVVVNSQNNKTWATSTTDKYGETLRFWLEPTTMKNNYFVVDVQVGKHLSYSSYPVFLYPGHSQETNIVTPWPPEINSAVTVKVYDAKSQLYSTKDGSVTVGFFDSNNKEIAESPVTSRGDAYFANLRVGDYVIRAMDETTGSLWGQSHITLDGTKNIFSLYEGNQVSNNQTNSLLEN